MSDDCEISMLDRKKMLYTKEQLLTVIKEELEQLIDETKKKITPEFQNFIERVILIESTMVLLILPSSSLIISTKRKKIWTC